MVKDVFDCVGFYMIGSASRKKWREARGLRHRKMAARKMEVILF
jgi:hypothetical protein